jgi:hypothetical protein
MGEPRLVFVSCRSVGEPSKSSSPCSRVGTKPRWTLDMLDRRPSATQSEHQLCRPANYRFPERSLLFLLHDVHDEDIHSLLPPLFLCICDPILGHRCCASTKSQHNASISGPTANQCAVAFSCPLVDEQGYPLVLGVRDAVSPISEMGYSFVECV